MIRCMTNTRGLDPFPAHALAGLPDDVLDLYDRWWKAARVVRLYRRRGWNESAVLYARDRARERFVAAHQEWEHRQNNPTLF